ncbi:MAG: hypothetical protein M1836_004993 [Candelina mexicana]|nr:MAG: hypothetical protein M1836_004993 [Candelina mexicana]
MSQQRVPSAADGLSLKVLRLSRPSLSYQTCLPHPTPNNSLHISPKAGLSYPGDNQDDQFILSPLLTLPPSFGSAYVGETFSCTLSANNELPTSSSSRKINSINISAEMQTPSQTVPLDLIAHPSTSPAPLAPGESVQRIVRFDLKEEGRHILAVRVNFSETLMVEGNGEGGTAASGGRTRTFRKLYQFEAGSCLNVRTKVTDISKVKGTQPIHVALEAQLEHVGESAIVLESVTMSPNPPFTSTSLNSHYNLTDSPPSSSKQDRLQTLHPRDIMQVAFLLTQQTPNADGNEAMRKDIAKEKVVVLGHLNISWRSAMGDKGVLTTGLLTLRRN